MSKPNTRRLKLAEMRDQAMDSLGMDPGIVLELPNGDTVTVPNPMLVADDVTEGLADADTVSTAKAVLGEDAHARLLEGGGTSNDVMLAWRIMSKEVDDKGPKLPK